MIIPVGFSEVRFLYTSSDLPNGAMCSWGVQNSDVLTPSQIAEGAVGVWNANMKPMCPSNVTLDQVMVKNGPNVSGPDATLAVGSGGTGAAGTVIGNTAVLVRKRTAVGGRKGRGRCYLPFVTEAELQTGMTLSSAFTISMDEHLASWLDCMDSIALTPYLLHSELGDAPTRIGSLGVDTLVATQRRRLRG